MLPGMSISSSLSRQDVKISWICDKNLNQKNSNEKANQFFTNIDEALKLEILT